jgi:hypothetical protein
VLSHAFRRISAGPIRILLAVALVFPLLALGSLPASSASSGMAVAAGTVTSPGGTAMPGVSVELYAWPSDAVLKAMKPGQAVPTTLLAAAATNTVGQYTLRVPAAQLKAAAVESGYANLEIFSPAGGMWFLPYQTSALPARPQAPVTVDLGRKPPPFCGIDPNGHSYNFTSFMLERTTASAWAVVGQGYILRQKQTAGDFVTFDYTEGTSHTQASELGLGISGYGADAGYSSAGSSTSTATSGEGFAPSFRNAWFRTEFSTGLFRGICYGPPRDSNVPYVHQHGRCPRKFVSHTVVFYVHKCFWMVRSTGWFGGATTVHPGQAPRTPAHFCAQQERLSHFHSDFGTAIQWSSGFSLGAALGVKGVNLKASFNGSAQTGYDTNALMDFRFGRSGFICGTNGRPSKAAILVQRGNMP